jgi:hypothetical protein
MQPGDGAPPTAPAPLPAPVGTPTPAPHPVSSPYHDTTGAICDGCSSCGNLFTGASNSYNGPRVWGDGEYLLWKIRNATLPPLTAVVPVGLLAVDITDTFQDKSGKPVTGLEVPVTGFVPVMILTNPQVAGGRTVEEGEHNGFRATVGFYLDSDQTCGIEGSGFSLNQRSYDFIATTGNSVNQFLVDTGFTRNTFLVTPGMNGAADTTSLLRSTNVFFVRQSSSTLTGSFSTNMWGAEINGVSGRCFVGCISFGGLIGARYVDFHEDLHVDNEVSLFRPTSPTTLGTAAAGVEPTPSTLPDPLNFGTLDTIQTRNRFYGGQIGADADINVGHFYFYARGKVALGEMHETINVDSHTLDVSGNLIPGGLLAAPTDNGTRSRNRICVLPEINVKLGYAITPNIRAFVGYDFLYISDVIRPGNQVELSQVNTQITVANSTNTITVNQPTIRFHDTDLWINGINFGLQLTF